MVDRKPVISFDMACTLFWEHGCDPKYPERPVRMVFYRLIEYLEKLGYRIKPRIRSVDLYEFYYKLWRETWEIGPFRELWHRYILLKFLYRLGIRVNYSDLDKAYMFFIKERAKLFHLPRRYRLLLELLRGYGYTIVLTTGTGAHDLPLEILRQNNASQYFSMVFSTQLIGIPKSDPRFYREVVNILGVEPYRVIHIGDSLNYDVYPALKSGLKTIYYGWRTQCRAAEPAPCITDLWELLDHLPTISTI